ncbi:type I restriction-modification system subunit M N-terminal domain-containing protein [Corynebacterium renale]|uniref:type I restriction-modification system subunit M N-terminal domain-containing protein n=1 Tax=Corynebacterium renale TaxID=1724 RepID=UPI000DFAF68E|nr:type I restriction-modification system subunit M N-terminal domain-containing protein [Corynebacterium renale]STC99787.1 type I restriction-modification system, methyltransferase subunit [Corynebacterium renale]
MIKGDLKIQVDRIWDAFWSGGISNPITVIEQFTYLLYMRQLDQRQKDAEFLANSMGVPIDQTQVFYSPETEHLRFSNLLAIDEPEARFEAFKKASTTLSSSAPRTTVGLHHICRMPLS